MKLLYSLCLLLATLPIAGCKTTSFVYTRTTVNGGTNYISEVRASDTRFIMMSDATVSGKIDPATGIVTIEVKVRSKGDAAMTQAIAEGVAKGAVEGMK